MPGSHIRYALHLAIHFWQLKRGNRNNGFLYNTRHFGGNWPANWYRRQHGFVVQVQFMEGVTMGTVRHHKIRVERIDWMKRRRGAEHEFLTCHFVEVPDDSKGFPRRTVISLPSAWLYPVYGILARGFDVVESVNLKKAKNAAHILGTHHTAITGIHSQFKACPRKAGTCKIDGTRKAAPMPDEAKCAPEAITPLFDVRDASVTMALRRGYSSAAATERADRARQEEIEECAALKERVEAL
ncbi:hypothetical protein BU17DRAFT_66205 [Hysterangium stoloniferum]|nr:hypothetical protein BU17DRAFT_66205 [Hysterangium stoloniferum]